MPMQRTFYLSLLIACMSAWHSPGSAQLLSDDDVTAETGGVAIGDNNFGDITIGLTEEEIRELVGQVMAEAEADNVVIAELATDLGVTRNAVTTFLGILGEEEVEQSKLTQKLTEVAQHYVELRDRAANLESDDIAVQAFIDQARSAIGEGEFDQADELLTRAEELDIAAARADEERARKRYLNAAQTRALRGENSLTQLRYLEAADHFAEAAELAPESEPTIRASYLAEQGRALTRGNRTLAAVEAYERATELDGNEVWPWIHLGRLHQQAGDLSVAEQAFLKAEAVAEGDGDERSLAASYVYVGEVRVAQGDLAGALEAYEAGLAIRQRLASADPGNAGCSAISRSAMTGSARCASPRAISPAR